MMNRTHGFNNTSTELENKRLFKRDILEVQRMKKCVPLHFSFSIHGQ